MGLGPSLRMPERLHIGGQARVLVAQACQEASALRKQFGWRRRFDKRHCAELAETECRAAGVVEVMSDNKAYATEVVSAEELGRLTVVGRVVWHGRKI